MQSRQLMKSTVKLQVSECLHGIVWSFSFKNPWRDFTHLYKEQLRNRLSSILAILFLKVLNSRLLGEAVTIMVKNTASQRKEKSWNACTISIVFLTRVLGQKLKSWAIGSKLGNYGSTSRKLCYTTLNNSKRQRKGLDRSLLFVML